LNDKRKTGNGRRVKKAAYAFEFAIEQWNIGVYGYASIVGSGERKKGEVSQGDLSLLATSCVGSEPVADGFIGNRED